jgi:hypothetical protein
MDILSGNQFETNERNDRLHPHGTSRLSTLPRRAFEETSVSLARVPEVKGSIPLRLLFSSRIGYSAPFLGGSDRPTPNKTSYIIGTTLGHRENAI